MRPPVLVPKPRHIEEGLGSFPVPQLWTAVIQPWMKEGIPAIKSLWPKLEFTEAGGKITFCRVSDMPREGYVLDIEREYISIQCQNSQGAVYAMATLAQLAAQNIEYISCCRIEDAPDLEIRGMLLDVSRGKVPRLETLKGMADLLLSLKMNHLELYIEGFSFGYPSFQKVWREESCILPEEMRQLSDYCRERFIELVPHQNSLGHMAPWLSRKEYRHLAETEEGLTVMGMQFPPTTVNAADEGSLKLVEQMVHDLAPCFRRGWFHTGLDEAFEFGKGKNKAFLEARGAEELLLPYIKSIRNTLAKNGFQMMMWDDLLVKYPKLCAELPEDILILNWGYDGEYPVEERAGLLQEAGKSFCLCPGTSSWSSFTGLTDNMITNISRAGKAAHKYGAKGLIVTDWGDMNHLQYQPVSYPGMVFGAAFAWSREGMTEEELQTALSRLVFHDAGERIGSICLEAGRFYLEEEFRLPCRSLACIPLMLGKTSREVYHERLNSLAESVTFFSPDEVCRAYLSSYENQKPFDGGRMYGFLEQRLAELDGVSLNCADAPLVLREYKNALRMLLCLTEVREEIQTGKSAGSYQKRLTDILHEHAALWEARNKPGGLKEGIRLFDKIR